MHLLTTCACSVTCKPVTIQHLGFGLKKFFFIFVSDFTYGNLFRLNHPGSPAVGHNAVKLADTWYCQGIQTRHLHI